MTQDTDGINPATFEQTLTAWDEANKAIKELTAARDQLKKGLKAHFEAHDIAVYHHPDFDVTLGRGTTFKGWNDELEVMDLIPRGLRGRATLSIDHKKVETLVKGTVLPHEILDHEIRAPYTTLSIKLGKE